MFKRYPYVSTIIILATVSLSFGLYGCSLKSAIPGKPLVFHGDSGGCGGIFVFKINNDNTIGISVSADKEILNLSTTDKTFEIGKTNGLQVEILQGKDIRSLYCTDVFLRKGGGRQKNLSLKAGVQP